MIEHETNVGLSERQRLMAEDLGPIINFLSNQAYGRARNVYNPTPDTEIAIFADFRSFSLDLSRLVQVEYLRMTEKDTPGSYNLNALNGLINSCRQTEISGILESLTHYPNDTEVMEEGLRTGIVMPLAAYQTLRGDPQSFQKQLPGIDIRVDIKDATKVLRDRRFHTILLQLSRTYNGFYGNESANPTVFCRNVHSPFSVFHNLGKIFKADEMKLAKPVRKHLRASYERANNPPNFRAADIVRSTIGCPARLATFRTLGEYAQAFADDNGIQHDELVNQGKPAIVGGCEFVACALEKQATVS